VADETSSTSSRRSSRSTTGNEDTQAAQDFVAEQNVAGTTAGSVTADPAAGPQVDGKTSVRYQDEQGTPEDDAAARAVTTTGLTGDGTPVYVAEDAIGEFRGKPQGAGPLSWRPRPGDIVYVKVDEDAAGRAQVVAGIVTRVLGQLPNTYRGWGVNVTTFGDGGATAAVDGLALFGGPDDARDADPQGPHGWIRRDA
jgi:hypothetical protein